MSYYENGTGNRTAGQIADLPYGDYESLAPFASIQSILKINGSGSVCLSVVIPCYNEMATLEHCLHRVLAIADSQLKLEIIIVDDGSTDGSLSLAQAIADKYGHIIKVLAHEKNQGKGAAIRTGISQATGDFIAIQDADLEYEPRDLRRLLVPLVEGRADVVIGSRFLSSGGHRVLYYWHSMGNRLLTTISNMFTDLNLTDMESCYKVFRRHIIQQIEIRENRFGFEPEIVAKVAHMRVRVYEMGISYHGRTYEEGKKIGFKDGLRALYCVFRYNAHHAPLPIQFLIYLFIGGTSALINLVGFLTMHGMGFPVEVAAPSAFIGAAAANYLMCILVLFRHQARWNKGWEIIFYIGVVILLAGFDMLVTRGLILSGFVPSWAKLIATGFGLVLNFLARRFLIFNEPASGPWKPLNRVDKN